MRNSLQLSRRGFVLSALALAACKPGSALLELTGNTMGTTFNIVALDSGKSVDKAQLQQAVDQALSVVNAQMSNWDNGSEVSRLNAAGTGAQSVSAELAGVLNTAQQINADSAGYFDITLGPVIEAWGFGSPALTKSAPDAAALELALATSGQAKMLDVAGGTLRKADAATQMYLPSIGKGFGVDHVARALTDLGLSDFMVEIGGDLYVAGMNARGTDWQIGIESPDLAAHEAFRVASLSNMGMATSGDYRNYFEEDGKRFSHIIDPMTGQPVQHRTASVTVLHDNAMQADAWSTGLLAAGSERGLELARDNNIAALFIDRTDAGLVESGSEKFISLQG